MAINVTGIGVQCLGLAWVLILSGCSSAPTESTGAAGLRRVGKLAERYRIYAARNQRRSVALQPARGRTIIFAYQRGGDADVTADQS